MKVQALILVLLVPWFVHAEQQYYGTRVASLALSGSESQADLDVLPIHPGDLITPENIRSALQALYNTGHYSYVEVDAAPDASGGTRLTFNVHSNFFFSTIRLEPEIFSIGRCPDISACRMARGSLRLPSIKSFRIRRTCSSLKGTSKRQLLPSTISKKPRTWPSSRLASYPESKRK